MAIPMLKRAITAVSLLTLVTASACAHPRHTTGAPEREPVGAREYALVVENRAALPLTLYYRLEMAPATPAHSLGVVLPNAKQRFTFPATDGAPQHSILLLAGEEGRPLKRVVLTAEREVRVSLPTSSRQSLLVIP